MDKASSDLDKCEVVENSGRKIRNLLLEQRKNRERIVIALEQLKELNYRQRRRKHFNRLFRGLPCREFSKFSTSTPWLDQVIVSHQRVLNELEKSIKVQNATIYRLKQSYRAKTGRYLAIQPKINFISTVCEICNKSILPCYFHKSIYKEHTCNKELIEKLPKTVEYGLDTEQVSVLQRERKPSGEPKYANKAFRVAIVANVRKSPLIYHSFWLPEGKIRSYQPITHISTSEIIQNKHLFKPFKEGRKELLELINNRVIVFANARSDISALEIDSSDRFRDIQTYYKVFNDRNHSWEAKGLDYLIRNILLKEDRAGKHDPSSDSRYTLTLYRLIPKTHWEVEPKMIREA